MKQDIGNAVQETLFEHGILRNAQVEPAERKPSFKAFTDLRTNTTTLQYNPRFTTANQGAVFAGKKNVADPLETCVRHIASHECGHIPNRKRKACPGTFDEHVEHFYEPISAILAKTGKLGAVDSVANLVEDLIDNTLLAQGPHAGLSLFYDDVARTAGWDPAYDAYMRIQLYAWGDRQDKKLLTRHSKQNEPVQKAAQTFLRRIEQISGKGRRLAHAEIAGYFAGQENWKTIAEEFTRALEPLIPPQLNIPMCGFGRQMQEEMQDPTNRERSARRRYEKGKPKPSWMGEEEALDAVYSSLARQIEILVDAPRKATSLPLVPFRHEPFDPEEHELSQVNFRKPVIVAQQDTPFGIPGFSFGVPQHYIEQPLLVKKGITSFPEFKFGYVDCSETMRMGLPDPADAGSRVYIPWGDKSRYHHLCTSWYGIIEYLARRGILPNVQVTLGSFSSTSRVKHGLEDAKKLLFSPEWGETNIDPAALDKLLTGSKSVFFTVSDGGVQNWADVKEGFMQRAREHYYFHIQLGPHTAMSRALKRAGLPVYTVKNSADLEQLAITLTHNAYQSFIDETLEHTL
ncbi:MAG TPA: hypothetical protein VJC16_04030 [Candidatus Nanoarchaeia archaeon]|nr:hypothetical protein [Candidatus Nanoarchaeia archaeon]